MTVVASDDFEGYADLAALEAVWTPMDGVRSYNHVTLGGGGGVASVDVNTAYSGNYGFARTFTTSDGILANTTYTISATATGTGACQRGVIIAGPDAAHPDGTAVFGDPGTRSFSFTATSNADGELYVFLGLTFTSLGYWDYIANMSFAEMSIDDGVTVPAFVSGLPILGVDFDEIAYTAGVIYVEGVVVGLTRGALRFDPGETWEPLPYDGDFIAPVGVHEMTSQKPRFLGSFLPVGTRQLALYMPASTPVADGGSVTVSPAIPGTVLTSGQYVTNLSVVWPLFDGGTITVLFPYAFWTHYELNGADKGEVLVPCEILAVPLTASDVPYTITVTTPAS